MHPGAGVDKPWTRESGYGLWLDRSRKSYFLDSGFTTALLVQPQAQKES